MVATYGLPPLQDRHIQFNHNHFEKHTMPDGKVYHFDKAFKTGEAYFSEDGRPVIDIFGRFENGKNVEYFKQAIITPMEKL